MRETKAEIKVTINPSGIRTQLPYTHDAHHKGGANITAIFWKNMLFGSEFNSPLVQNGRSAGKTSTSSW